MLSNIWSGFIALTQAKQWIFLDQDISSKIKVLLFNIVYINLRDEKKYICRYLPTEIEPNVQTNTYLYSRMKIFPNRILIYFEKKNI